MSLDVYETKRLVKELLELFNDYKLVQTTRTTILRISPTSDPTGTETVVEYTIKQR